MITDFFNTATAALSYLGMVTNLLRIMAEKAKAVEEHAEDVVETDQGVMTTMIIVDFGFGGKTGHVFCLLICNPSFVILSL
jgi:hypothetical protein